MSFTIRAALAVLAIAAPVALVQAQTAQDQDHTAHHPTDQTAPQTSEGRMTQPGSVSPGQAGTRPMMDGNMGQMMRNMAAMHGMGAMGEPGRMQPFAHIEGQLAFYRAELKITDAQASQWNAFADAVRANAKKLKAALAAMPGAGPVSAVDRADRRVTLLSASLDASQAFAEAVKPLYAALSDDQKKIADELMAEHLRGM